MLDKQLWGSLEKMPRVASGLAALRLFPESKFNIFVAFEPATGHKLLMLKASGALLTDFDNLPACRGFGVRYTVTDADPDGCNCLSLELTDPSREDVFDVIGNDVLRHVTESHDAPAAFAAFVSRIVEWQQFLSKLPERGLSTIAQQGLFAELWFLREYLLKELPAEKAVRSWAGPDAKAKDFQFPHVAFEVKSTCSKQHASFRISSEIQLDHGDELRLIVFGLLLESLRDGGTSLSEMVDSIRSVLASHPTAEILFAELLLRAEYLDEDAVRYNERFGVRSAHFFDVKGLFPRIVEKDLRPGVGDVHYSISFSACGHYSLTEEEMRMLIRSLS